MPEIASPQSKYRGQQLPPDRQSFFYLCRSADDQYSVRPAPIAPLMAKPNCFLSTRFPTPPPLSSEHLILFPRSAGPLSTLSQAVHLYEDKENGASLLISRTNSSFSVRGVLGPDRAIRPRPDSAAPAVQLLPTQSDTGRDGSPGIDPRSAHVPPHWVTIAKHPLPGTDYQVNTRHLMSNINSILAGGGGWRC